MITAKADPYAFLAFDENSHALLGHGATAVEALLEADLAAPDAAIYVIPAGRLGPEFWDRQMDLDTAEGALDAQARWRAGRKPKVPLVTGAGAWTEGQKQA
jgi:hypothetical protein